MEGKRYSLKTGIETSILSTIADGDDDLVRMYKNIPNDPDTKAKRINEEIVSSVTRKAKINIDQIASVLSRANHISICFLLDTTGSMSSYIVGVKEQILEIVKRIEETGCAIEGIAFIGKQFHLKSTLNNDLRLYFLFRIIGYKDWCDDIVGKR